MRRSIASQPLSPWQHGICWFSQSWEMCKVSWDLGTGIEHFLHKIVAIGHSVWCFYIRKVSLGMVGKWAPECGRCEWVKRKCRKWRLWENIEIRGKRVLGGKRDRYSSICREEAGKCIEACVKKVRVVGRPIRSLYGEKKILMWICWMMMMCDCEGIWWGKWV